MRPILRQTVGCGYGRKVELTIYDDGTVIVSGARRVNVIQKVENMGYDIQKLAPESHTAVMVLCTPDSLEAEMVRYNAPWVGVNEIPRMSANFMPLSSGVIHLNCSKSPEPVPIATLKKVPA